MAKELILRNAEIVSIVDDEDFERISKHKWRISSYGYVVGYIPAIRKQVYLHRFVLNMEKGKGQEIDHINGNKLDNRKENLRPCSRAENLANRATKNKTGYKGVNLRKDGRYDAVIAYTIGVYDNIEDAARAYDREAYKIYGKFTRLNNI